MSPDTSDSKLSSKRPSCALLEPPATIISPPSPTDPKDFHPPTFNLSPQIRSPAGSDEDIEYDSPEEGDGDTPSSNLFGKDVPPPKPRAPSDSLGPVPLAATNMSNSPLKEPSLLRAESPSPSSSRPRSPSPSSPHFRPRTLHHRRTSSTHRVRETTDGHQRSTEDGQRMINQYRIGESLGQGAYAKVEIGVDVGSGKKYAVKEFSKSRLHYQSLQEKHRKNTRGRNRRAQEPGSRPMGEEQRGGPWGGTQTTNEDPLGLVRREIAVMKKLDHPNIVLLYEAISVPNADSLFLVLEYMSGGTLMDVRIGEDEKDAEPPFDLRQTREYFRQLCLGLEYLHANEVIHRDIKPDNVLLSADRQLVKLCDFGVSEMFTSSGDDRIKTSGGSPAFQSPESFTAHTQELHGKAVDIWALGVTLYCMLTGSLPFNVSNPLDLFEAVREKEPRIPSEWESCLQDLIKRMLRKDPQQRIEMSVIREHSWVTDNGDEPMIDTEENLYHVGKHVEEPTQEELRNAIGSLRGIFTVIRAVQKMRRLQLHRRSLSSQGGPGGPLSPGGSTNVSMASGSMDSYVSQDPATSATSVSDETEDPKYRDLVGDTVTSPRDMTIASPADTAREEDNPFDRLKPIDTGVVRDNESEGGDEDDEEGVVLMDSPVSGDEDQSTPVGHGST